MSVWGGSTVSIKASDSPSIDAFGRLRVSSPQTLFDSKQLHDAQPLIFDDQEVSGGSTTSAHSTNTASTTIGVGATTAGKRVRQSFMRMNYQPGKSQEILITGVLNLSGGGTGIKQAFGYFDDENGLFLQNNEGTIQLVKRSYATGAAVDTEVAQSAWNLDTMDGSGPSKIALDFTKAQILFIDFEWLGVGRVRMGFVVDGKIIYCHQFVHANNIAVVYMSTPNLPIRFEIENDGTGAASTLMHICASVISEGGSDKTGILHHTDGTVASSLANTAAYALIGIRLKSTHLDASVIIESISLIGSANDQCDWELAIGPTVAGTFTYNNYANSAVQVAQGTSSNTVTGGTLVDGGYFSTNLGQTIQTKNALYPGSYIDGTPQEWVLVARPITNNITLRSSITWRELQ